MARFDTLEEIKAWQSAREVTRDIFVLFRRPGLRREFTLKDQMTRAALSVMNNIAEGFGRNRPRDFANFLTISRGSGIELQSMLHVMKDLNFLTDEEFATFFSRIDSMNRMINSLSGYLRRKADGDKPGEGEAG